MRLRVSLIAATLIIGIWLATSAWAAPFFFSTGNPDGRLGALSQRPSPGQLETETADDFLLTQTAVIAQATITGLIPLGAPLANISNVEVELYHIFPQDSRHARWKPGNASFSRNPAEWELLGPEHRGQRHPQDS